MIDSFICWIYLFLISLSPQYGSLLSSYLRVSPAESTLVLYVVFICRGVARSAIPTTTRTPYPLCWYCYSSYWLVQHLARDLQASLRIYQITTNLVCWTSEQNDYTFIPHTDDLVYLWRIRTWNYYHIDKECKMGFLHQQGTGDNDTRGWSSGNLQCQRIQL